ncbi:uncharacterized protein [Aegilops tauschii subsp. strangulata]|uniref:uncharacterized protein n=1 Tax=Aegilops tauschii subsp. strangulata TaxID=200361 RepID=UPI000989F61E|nr:uncharacterized protein LOC109786003 [Aegilops tauschii subsp. strangulata]
MAGEAGGKGAAVAKKTPSTPSAPVATPLTKKDGGSASGGSGKSPAESKTPDPAASLSARLGGMVLMDKEVEGFIFDDPNPAVRKSHRWSAIGKVCSPRPMKMSAMEKAMPRAWGLHKEAKFAEIGPNIFEVQFGSEGDWRHVLHNGPWQFDFSVLVMKDYEGDKRPSEMIFDKIDVWVRVTDLPPDRRTEAFGRALGNWLGEIVWVDVDKERLAREQHLRVRAKISVYEPLVRGFYLRTKREDKEKTWFDFHYEKVPHFCFDCGRLVHVEGECDPPVDSSM